MVPSGVTAISTNSDAFISDNKHFGVVGLGGNSVFGFHSPHLVAKAKSGVFQSATYQGIGEITGGTIIEGLVTNNFIGSFSLIGTTVATSSFRSLLHKLRLIAGVMRAR